MLLESFEVTLNSLTKQSAGFFSQCMVHHCLVSRLTLIRFASLGLHPEFVIGLWTLAARILSIPPFDYVTWNMFDAVHLFCIYYNLVPLIFVRKYFLAFLQKPAPKYAIKLFICQNM